MNKPVHEFPAAHRQAVAWFCRLSRLSIAVDELHAFREWRRDPVNREAYERLTTVRQPL